MRHHLTRKLNIIFTLLIIFISCSCTPTKSNEDLILDRLNTFVDTYNSGDLEKTLESFDAKTRNTLESTFKLSESLLGKLGLDINLDDLFGFSVGTISDDDILSFSNIHIESIHDTSAKVALTMTFSDDFSSPTSKNVIVDMAKENNDWFISDLN